MNKTTTLLVLSGLTLACASAFAAGEPVISLITKTRNQPLLRENEGRRARRGPKLGAKLLTGAGKTDGDNAGQITAMENMIAGGAKTILITPSDSKAIVPAIKKAQEKA